jgi:hypothetical protein
MHPPILPIMSMVITLFIPLLQNSRVGKTPGSVLGRHHPKSGSVFGRRQQLNALLFL